MGDERENRRSPRRSAKRRRRTIWIASLAVLVAVTFVAKPVYHRLKTKRANQLSAEAEEFARAGKLSEAANKYRAALQLDPLGYHPLRGAALLATRLHHSEATPLWQQVVALPQATVADREEYAASLLQDDQISAAEKVIDKLLTENPGTRALLLASRYSQRVGNSARAFQYAHLAANRAPDDEMVRLHLAELLAASSQPADTDEARQILWKLAATKGPAKKAAIEALVRDPDLAVTDEQKLLDALHAVSPFTAADSLLEADLHLRFHPESAAAIYDQVISKWSADETTRVQLAQWLNLHQQADRVLALVPMEVAITNNQLMLARLDALATQQRWDEIDATLSRHDLAFDPSIIESFRARSAQEQHTMLAAELHWNKAIALANGDLNKLHFIAAFAERSGANEAASRAFDQLTRSPQYLVFALAGQQRLAKARDIRSSRAIAEKMLALHQDDPNVQNRVAYYDLLLEKDVDANVTKAKELVAKFPDRLEFRVTAALGFLRKHDASSALAQFQGPPIEWEKAQPSWRAIYAAALRANEEEPAAKEIIATIPMDKLTPEERRLIEAK